MDPNRVRQLEEHVGTAIAEELQRHFPDLPLRPRTSHLMAKAAVAVLEAIEEEPGPPRQGGRR